MKLNLKTKHWVIGFGVIVVVSGIIYLLYRNSKITRISGQVNNINAKINSNTSPDQLLQLSLQKKALLDQL